MTNKTWLPGTFMCALFCLHLGGCSEPTVGQQFRDIMAEIDAECKRNPAVGSFVSPVNGIYSFVDAIEFVDQAPGTTHIVHYSVDPEWKSNARLYAPPYGKVHSIVDQSKARYGFTFRNSPLENRELGILGQELIILDLKTREILAFRRRFGLLKFESQQSIQLMHGPVCRALQTVDSDNRFVARVLKPAASAITPIK